MPINHPHHSKGAAARQVVQAALAQSLGDIPADARLWVAYSGGVDSHVLLHALQWYHQRLRPSWQLGAVHINHGLHPHAQTWDEHCARVCATLHIAYQSHRVNVDPQGHGLEAAARAARYAALRTYVQAGDYVLMAHHCDDQAETMLLRLMRGTGIRGLASMPTQRALGNAQLRRPLLAVSRSVLLQYATQHGLQWIEDDSNHDTRFARNYIRHRILTPLTQRWPEAPRHIARTAALCAQAQLILDEVATEDMQTVAGSCAGTLSVRGLLALSLPRCQHVLRRWMEQRGYLALSERQLKLLYHTVLQARPDAAPNFRWTVTQPKPMISLIRRYRDDLYLGEAHPNTSLTQHIPWNLSHPLHIPHNGTVHTTLTQGEGLAQDYVHGRSCELRFRSGGESIRPAYRHGLHSLKKLYQEWGIPPWLRASIPLLYIDNTLAAVVGYCVAESFSATAEATAYRLHYTRDCHYSAKC